ncbi:PD-(D/E)XK nuclease-like domain-containing protein [Salmonella enterica]|nr:PD-(D/E)XK nuclease-like domain-containing protein [Salmonella enterica]
MSIKQEEYSFYYKVKNESARKRLGFKAGFFWCTAKKQSLALSRGELAMDAAGFDEADFARPVRVHFPVENDIPPEGVFDTKFCENREPGGEDGKTLTLIPGAASAVKSDETERADGAGTPAGENGIQESHNPPANPQLTVVATLPFRHRVLAQYIGDGEYLYHVDTDQKKEILRLEMDTDNSYVQNLLLAAENVEAFKKAIEHDIHKIVNAVKKVFPVDGKTPELATVIQFLKTWFETEHIDRGLLVKEWAKGNRVSANQRTESGANAGGGNKTDRNPDYEHTLDTLDVEIAMATLPMDFNIYELPGSVYRRAKEIVKKKESPFKEWSAALRATPGILDYSRAAIFALIRSAHPEFYHYPGRLQGYINANLTETDHENPTEEALTAARHTPEKDAVEEANRQLAAARGEYVEGISDPNDPKWVHNNYSASNQGEKEEVAPEAVTRNADGTFDVSALFPPPSNQTEKTKARTERDGEMRKESNQQETAGDAVQEITADGGSGTGSDEAGETADPVENGNITVPDDIQPGIYYDIPNEAYHAGPGVSKSQLDDIADTPAIYLWRKNAPVDTEKTKSLDTGTAFHCRVLEPEEFSKRFIIAPEFNRRTSAGKEEEKTFLEECARTGRTVLTAEEGRKIELMYQSVMALPLGQWLVESAGYAESSVYWEDPETEILCRCRPDKIIPEFHWIMDVKTTADIQRFRTAYYDYRYHVQDAFYSDGYRAQFGEIPTFVFLVASTTAECGRYPVEIFMMGEDAKLAGQREYRRNLQTLAECLNNDEWPAIKTLSLPRWAKENANA